MTSSSGDAFTAPFQRGQIVSRQPAQSGNIPSTWPRCAVKFRCRSGLPAEAWPHAPARSRPRAAPVRSFEVMSRPARS